MTHATGPTRFDDLERAVDALLARIDGPLHLATPLGLGKPHRLLNALYARIAADPERRLHVYTALSLDPPRGRSDLERRFLDPPVARLSGHDFPPLAHVAARQEMRNLMQSLGLADAIAAMDAAA